MITFEEYLAIKDLKESTKKKYIKSWCSGKPIKTVENHYMKYTKLHYLDLKINQKLQILQ